jgi:hypothetical protein
MYYPEAGSKPDYSDWLFWVYLQPVFGIRLKIKFQDITIKIQTARM